MRMVEALHKMDTPLERPLQLSANLTADQVREVGNRVVGLGNVVNDIELSTVTRLVRGHRYVEVPGSDRSPTDPHPEPLLFRIRYCYYTTSSSHARTNSVSLSRKTHQASSQGSLWIETGQASHDKGIGKPIWAGLRSLLVRNS